MKAFFSFFVVALAAFSVSAHASTCPCDGGLIDVPNSGSGGWSTDIVSATASFNSRLFEKARVTATMRRSDEVFDPQGTFLKVINDDVCPFWFSAADGEYGMTYTLVPAGGSFFKAMPSHDVELHVVFCNPARAPRRIVRAAKPEDFEGTWKQRGSSFSFTVEVSGNRAMVRFSDGQTYDGTIADDQMIFRDAFHIDINSEEGEFKRRVNGFVPAMAKLSAMKGELVVRTQDVAFFPNGSPLFAVGDGEPIFDTETFVKVTTRR